MVARWSSLEKAMAPHSSTLAWKIPWMEEPGRLQSMGSLRVGHDWATSLSLFHFTTLEKEMATHSSVLAWRIPGTGEPGGLSSLGSHRVGHDWSDLAAAADGHLNLEDCETKQYNQACMVIPYPAVYITLNMPRKIIEFERLLPSREFTPQLWVKDIHTQKVIW